MLPTPEGPPGSKFREVEFDQVKEPWAEYVLENGIRVRVRATVRHILVGEGPDGAQLYAQNGDPQVTVNCEIQVTASAPAPAPRTKGEKH
jgi:hypothetical protein